MSGKAHPLPPVPPLKGLCPPETHAHVTTMGWHEDVHSSIADKNSNLEMLCSSKEQIDSLWRITTDSFNGRSHSSQYKGTRSTCNHMGNTQKLIE